MPTATTICQMLAVILVIWFKFMLTWIKENWRLIYSEALGERTNHPLLARILAFLVDYGLFLVSGLVIYLALGPVNNQGTGIQLFIDIFLWTTYLTLGNSKICKGQTLGKKLLRIRVVDNQANYLGPIRSLLRSFPIVLLLNSYPIMFFIITDQSSLYFLGITTLITILIGVIYFPLLTLERQGIHDLLVFSQVIPSARIVKIEKKEAWGLIIGFVLIVSTTVFLLN